MFNSQINVIYKEPEIKSKLNEKSLLVNESNKAVRRVENNCKVLCEYQRIKTDLTATRAQVDTCIDQGRQRIADITTKITDEKKQGKVIILF